MEELISRQKAKDAIDMALDHIDHVPPWVYDNLLNALNEVPSVEPTHKTPSITLGALDCVDRRLVSYKLTDLVNEFEEILSHIREREENDSVCGLCEYDGAYMGQSGDWCNECPGFDKADCFKLKDKYKKEWLELMNSLPSVQPKERCIATITLSEEDIERIVKEQVEEIKEMLPRKGKWTYRGGKLATIGESYAVICSECNEWFEYCTNFCPNCGADMRGDSDEKD